MQDRMIESKPNIFLYRCEKNALNYEIEIQLQANVGLVTNFLIENQAVESFICEHLIDDQTEPAEGLWYITGFESVLTNELSLINLYYYQVYVRKFRDTDEISYNEVDIMDFEVFLNYQEFNNGLICNTPN